MMNRYTFGRRVRWTGMVPVVLTLLSLAAPPAPGAPQSYTSGHGDIGVGFDGSSLELHLHLEGGILDGVPTFDEFDPSDVVITLEGYLPGATFTRPASDGGLLAFTGVAPGGTGFLIPKIATAGLPFLGLATEELDPAEWTMPIAFLLVSVSGPGVYSLWDSDGFGGLAAYWSSSPGFTNLPVFLPAGSHAHFNHGFSEPGTYFVTLEVIGTPKDMEPITGRATYQFEILAEPVPEPATLALAAVGLLGAAVLRRFRCWGVNWRLAVYNRGPGKSWCWVLSLLALSGTARAAYEKEYTAGHADISVVYPGSGNSFTMIYNAAVGARIDGVALTASQQFLATELTTVVPPWSQGASSSPVNRPSGAQWDFLGVPAGQPVYYLPASLVTTVPFLGFGTEFLNPAEWATPVTWSLIGVTGSGFFSLWQSDVFGNPIVRWASADGFANDAFTMGANSHDHYNFGFTQQGIYDVTIRAVATRVGGLMVLGEAIYRFNVGPVPIPEPSSLGLIALGLGCGLAGRRWCRRRLGPISE